MSRSRYLVIALIGATTLICGCGAATDESASATVAVPDTSIETPTPSSLELSPLTIVADTQETTVTTSPGVDPSMQGQVDLAVADLATRLSIDASGITTISAKGVTWPDGSLGCPQPGMVYTQVTVDGALIELGAGGATYSYHSGGSRAPFLCQKT